MFEENFLLDVTWTNENNPSIKKYLCVVQTTTVKLIFKTELLSFGCQSRIKSRIRLNYVCENLHFVSNSNDSNAQKVPGSISISSDITEHITFLHKTFPVPPSMRAIIEVDVSYPNSSDRIHDLIMGIYTTYNHVLIIKQCSYVQYTQLGNQGLHPTIRLDV